MSRSWRWAPAALLLAIAACAPMSAAPPATATGAATDFVAWSETFAADWVRQSPEQATQSQYFSGAEQARLDGELSPLTLQSREHRVLLAQQGLKQLARFDAAVLSTQDRVGAATLRWSLQRTVDGAPFEDHRFIFNQLWGTHLGYVNLLSESQPLRRLEDLPAFQSRLALVPLRLDEALQRAQAAAGKGLLPPSFIAERSLKQVRDFLAQPAGESDIVAGLARRSASMPGLSAEARRQQITQATAVVQQQLRPAYQRIEAFLVQLLPRTNRDAGLWRLPQGAAAYQQALVNFTTTSMSADQIHELGLREVSRIEAQMDQVLKGLGRNEGSVNTRMEKLQTELQPPAEPDPRPALLAQFTAAVQDAQRRAQPLFNLQPRAPVEVRRVPALTERTAAAHYTTPAPDGSRPGVFWAPLPGPSFNIMGMRSLVVHEAVPGHHFQLALQQEQATLPRWRQRRVFGGGSAHSEGWALYAERLALEEGWYEGDPHALLGALNAQLFRARRLVVDTGLHARRWTREQAIDYGISVSEVERYVSNPGQACAYMVGMLHILKLRDEAKTQLGTRFTLPDFHDVVLKTGSVPLDVLSDVVRDWLAQRLGS